MEISVSLDGFSVFDDSCPHRRACLSSDKMVSGSIQCPYHGMEFDIFSGEVTSFLGEEPKNKKPLQLCMDKYCREGDDSDYRMVHGSIDVQASGFAIRPHIL